MKIELAIKIVDVIEDSGSDAKIYANYCGRGMMGRGTTGVATSLCMGQVLALVISYADLFTENDEPLFEVSDLVVDNLGLDYILY